VHVRVIELPASQVATTGPTPDPDPFAPGATLARFDAWFSARTDPLALAPRDLMWQDGGDGPLVWSWLLAPDEDVADAGWAVERFAGGLYAAGVARDGDDADGERVLRELRAWVEASPFDLDESAARPVAFRVTTSPAAARVLGHHQLELLVPVREPA
jgi:hypothetical protein